MAHRAKRREQIEGLISRRRRDRVFSLPSGNILKPPRRRKERKLERIREILPAVPAPLNFEEAFNRGRSGRSYRG